MQKQRRKSAVQCNCTADQRLCFHYRDSTILPLLINHSFKVLAFFCGCTGWFVSDLVQNPENWFPHDTAHFNLVMRKLCLSILTSDTEEQMLS